MGLSKEQLLAGLKLQVDFPQHEHPVVLTVEAQQDMICFHRAKYVGNLGGGLSENLFLKANPSVGKDQPPDLACFVPSGSTVLPDPPQPATSSAGRVEIQVSVDNKSTASIDDL